MENRNQTYKYKNCQSLFGYAQKVHARFGGVCQLCGFGKGLKIDFDAWRQMTVEHLIGKKQGGYLLDIKKAIAARFSELSPEECRCLAQKIEDANTISACRFCNSMTSREKHSRGMTQLIQKTQGTPTEVIKAIELELKEIFKHKQLVVKKKLQSVREAFEGKIEPELNKSRGNI